MYLAGTKPYWIGNWKLLINAVNHLSSLLRQSKNLLLFGQAKKSKHVCILFFYKMMYFLCKNLWNKLRKFPKRLQRSKI